MRRIVLVGSAKANRELIPAGDYEVWSILQNNKWLASAEKWFELHDMEKPTWGPIKDIITQNPSKVYTQRGEAGSIEYPLEDICTHFDTRYFTSTFDFMIALAMYDHNTSDPVDQIDVVGFNFHGAEEYERQLPGASYWIGRAEGMGIRVNVQEQSAMKKAYKMYAYGGHTEVDLINEKKLAIEIQEKDCIETIESVKGGIAELNAKLSSLTDHYNKILGAKAAINDTRELLLRGGA